MSTDPLQSLVSDDTKALDRQKLAGFLKPFVTIDSSKKEICYLPSFHKLSSNPQKLEIVFLASKARSLLFGLPEGLSQVDIIRMDILPDGSVKSVLKRFYDDKIVKKDESGRYFLPSYKAAEFLEKLKK